MVFLEKSDIVRGLMRIDALAKEAGFVVDVSIYGGAAMVLAFDMRYATRDVDAVVKAETDFLRNAARQVAQEEGWDPDWLNDGVKGFTSAHEEMLPMEGFDAPGDGGGLRVFRPSAEYLFAMKCMAMRPEGADGSHDISDIEALAVQAGIQTAEDALAIVESFYPAKRIPPKVLFGVVEIMERMETRHSNVGASADPTPGQ